MAQSAPVKDVEAQVGAGRRRTIVDAARDSFLAEGYAATSMASIASRLGWSKATLYNHFNSKEELFAAVMETHFTDARAALDAIDVESGNLRDRLLRLGEAYLSVAFSERYLAVHRLVTGESSRFPEMGRAFYEAAGKRGKMRLTELFRDATAQEDFKADNPELAARQFLSLCRTDIHDRLLWNVPPAVSPDEISRQVADAVDVILAAYSK
jgi:TetR/AcrR family transcriptional repressor of mexJK operon